MSYTHCLVCRVQFNQMMSSSPERTYTLPVWGDQTTVCERYCIGCRAMYVFQKTTSGMDQCWPKKCELLADSFDYIAHPIYLSPLNQDDPYGFKCIGDRDAVWAWTPGGQFHVKMIEATIKSATMFIKPLYVANREVPYGDGLAGSSPIRIFSHVMQGASGYLPSVRAEIALTKTLARLGVNRIFHFWPSFTLPKKWYIPLFEDDELKKLWAVHARMQPFEVQQ